MEKFKQALKNLVAAGATVGVFGVLGEKISTPEKTKDAVKQGIELVDDIMDKVSDMNISHGDVESVQVKKSNHGESVVKKNKENKSKKTEQKTVKTPSPSSHQKVSSELPGVAVDDVPQKQWLLDQMQSDAYQERAEREGLSGDDIAKRVNRLESTEVRHVKKDEIYPDGTEAISFVDIHEDKEHHILAGNKAFDPSATLIVHEAQHIATLENEGLSDHARKLYSQSYKKSGHTEEYEKYLQDNSERDARKKQLEYELEQLGIKTYSEPFTQKTFDTMMRLYRKGKFTYGPRQLIEGTKPEYFLQIMNEIAENNSLEQNIIPTAPENLPVEQNG